jgi:hypothetical protein
MQPTDHVLEIGFGPGLAIQQVARLVPTGHVVGIDHSALMVQQAGRRNQAAVLHLIRSVLKPSGLVATTVQLRHRGATAADAHAFGRQLSKELIDAGFRGSPSRSSTSSPFLRCACSRADDMNTRHVTGSHRDRAVAAGFGEPCPSQMYLWQAVWLLTAAEHVDVFMVWAAIYDFGDTDCAAVAS